MAPVFKTSNWCGTNRIKKKEDILDDSTELNFTLADRNMTKKKSRVQNKTKSKEITSS